MKKLVLLLLFLFNFLLVKAQAVTIKPETFQYTGVVGATFSAPSNFNITGSGFFFNNGTAGTLAANANFHLPNGATITEMTAIYVDNSATQNMTFRLLRQGFTGGAVIETLALTPTSSSNVQATTIPVSPEYTTNTGNEVYFVQVGLSNTSVTWPGNALTINGVIIKYKLE
ncbi:hypothetical protein [Runella aurantiaca]|uniref:DUF4402 domain-containing protein n=1 Tax=Runella aurantiaca TaxID=2282308 RepID=A0A369I074_9BACT|nr:hypothetical protein [Runella aurantiaca]RDB03181.1 hypothetical protein DVG78_25110 [Runella aurantiaca]